MQLDLFNTSKEDYLYNEIQKVEGSLKRRTNALFGLYDDTNSEIMAMKDQILELKEAIRMAHERTG